MRVFASVLTVFVVIAAAPRAGADDAPPTPTPAPTPAPAPPPAPASTPASAVDVAPTPAERSRALELVPALVPTSQPAPSAACGCSDCFQSRDECGWPLDSCGSRLGRWNVTIAGQYSALGSPDGILGEDLFVPGNHLNWNGVDYDGELCGRLGIAYRVEPQSWVEFVGTYYGSSDGSDAEQGQLGARPGATGIGDISRVVDASFASDAETWGLEFNWWTELACKGRWRIDAGLGARYLSFEETAHVDFTTSPAFVGPFPIADGFVDSFAENKFYGGQLCLAAHWDADCRWELGASLKALFGSIDRNLTVTDDSVFAGGLHSAREGDDEFVFGLNLDLSATWHLTPRVAILGGYDLLFLDNVQRAEDGMDFSQSNSGAVQARQDPDQLVIHSLFLGVVFTF